MEIAEKLAVILNVPTAYLYCSDDLLAEVLLDLHGLSEQELLSVRGSIKRIGKRSHEA